jgi:hypothetical protein
MITPQSDSSDRGMDAIQNFKKKLQLESLNKSLYLKDTRNIFGDVIKTIPSERISKSKDVFRPGIFKRKIGFGMIDQKKSGQAVMLEKSPCVMGDGRAAISSMDKKVQMRTITEISGSKFPWLGIANREEGYRKGSPPKNLSPIKKINFGLSMSSPYLKKIESYM